MDALLLTFSVNLPLMSVIVPWEGVPTSIILAPIMASPFALVTTPVIVFSVC
ncbi:hypothetical protein DSECCO2_452800 [anaerobic digester metagenome]